MAETEPVCLDIRMGNASAEIANWRMDWRLSELYQQPRAFFGEVSAECGILYTDQLDSSEPPTGQLAEFQ